MSYSILRVPSILHGEPNTRTAVVVECPREASDEQLEVIGEFATMLVAVTADGGRKRAAGLKPSWKVDLSHRAAIFSHLNKREHGELKDPDSGAHPYVHLAWRALAVAWQESAPAPMQEHEELLREAGRILAKPQRHGTIDVTPDEIQTLLNYHTLRIEARAAGRPIPQAIRPLP